MHSTYRLTMLLCLFFVQSKAMEREYSEDVLCFIPEDSKVGAYCKMNGHDENVKAIVRCLKITVESAKRQPKLDEIEKELKRVLLKQARLKELASHEGINYEESKDLRKLELNGEIATLTEEMVTFYYDFISKEFPKLSSPVYIKIFNEAEDNLLKNIPEEEHSKEREHLKMAIKNAWEFVNNTKQSAL